MNKQLWKTICKRDDLVLNSGVCALVNNQQVAIFLLDNGGEQIFALSNFDPIGKANVMYRGILGSVKGIPVVASPLYKQHFKLETGECIEDATVAVDTFNVRMQTDEVQLQV